MAAMRALILAQGGLELCEGHLDRIEIGRIGRQVHELCPGRFESDAHLSALVGGQIVHHDDVARPERGCENLPHVEIERRSVHGAVEHHGRGHPGGSESADEGRGLPMAMRHGSDAAGAARGSAVAARHLGRGARFVDEHQPVDGDLRLQGLPACASCGHVGP